MTTSPSRTKTPPALKWLLNERAAIVGALDRNAKAQKRLLAESERATLTLAKATRQLALIALQDDEYRQQAAALGTTISLLDARVDPAAAGSVAPWAGKYGERGGLTRYLVQVLQRAEPHHVPTSVLVDLVIDRFALEERAPLSLKDLRDTIRTRLVRAQRRHPEIQLGHVKVGAQTFSAWGWKPEGALDQLRALARAQEFGHDPPVDAAGGQMDRQ